MTKEMANTIGDEVMEAVKLIAEKYGMVVKRGGGVYTDSSYKINNIMFDVKGENANSRFTNSELEQMKEEFSFARLTHPEIYELNVGDVFEDAVNGKSVVLLGWKRRNRKYPVLVETLDGESVYKITPHQLSNLVRK